MKHFETAINNEWRSWKADDKTTISKKAGIVTVVQDGFIIEGKPHRVKMVFNLNTIPVYATVE